MRIRPFLLEDFFLEWEFNCSYLLGASDCEALAVADLIELVPPVEEGLRQLRLSYTEVGG